MNTLAFPQGFGISMAGEGISLLGLPAEHTAKQQLARGADEVVRTAAAVLNEMLLQVIDKRTSEEFQHAMNQAFPNYMRLILSFAGVVASIVPPHTINRLASESLCELEANIRDHALLAFGADMRDRGIFTVWTLRKISDLLQLMSFDKVSAGDKERQKEFLTYFLYHALRARFGIDCLTTSMQNKRPIYPDALFAVDDSLRSAVNAYAWIRQAVDLHREPENDSIHVQTTWDDEDQELLNESMCDLISDGH